MALPNLIRITAPGTSREGCPEGVAVTSDGSGVAAPFAADSSLVLPDSSLFGFPWLADDFLPRKTRG